MKTVVNYLLLTYQKSSYPSVDSTSWDTQSIHWAWGPEKHWNLRIIIRILIIHFCNKLFPRLKLVTSWSCGNNINSHDKTPLKINWNFERGINLFSNSFVTLVSFLEISHLTIYARNGQRVQNIQIHIVAYKKEQ